MLVVDQRASSSLAAQELKLRIKIRVYWIVLKVNGCPLFVFVLLLQ